MIFPSIYRAKATRWSGTSLTVLVPQIFGEAPVTVTDFTGEPTTGMGWVLFQGGNPEFPVWLGRSISTGGTSNGGVDEVWIGPDTPAGPEELWVDTDATSPMTAGLLPIGGTAGQSLVKTSGVDYAAYWDNRTGARMGSVVIGTNQTGIVGTTVDLTGYTLTFTTVLGRFYAMHYVICLYQQTAASTVQIEFWDNGVNQGIAWRASVPVGITMATGFLMVSPGAGSHTIKLRGFSTAGTLDIVSGSICNGRYAIIDAGW